MNYFPDWLLVSMTGASLCAVVLGKWRWALVLATPALLRFVIWPLFLHYLAEVPLPLLLLVGLIAVPILLLRGLHSLIRLTSSDRAADHAMGDFLGRGLLAAARRFRRRRR